MKRRLLKVSVAAALLFGGWGGVLAAATCAEGWHLAGADHACCREHEDREQGHHEAAGRHAQAERETGEASCHDSAGGEEPARAQAAVLQGGRASSSCAHCLRRSEERPTPLATRGSGQTARADGNHAPPAQNFLIPERPTFVASITPRDGSPPGGSSKRRVLLNVFLI